MYSFTTEAVNRFMVKGPHGSPGGRAATSGFRS
jgi:hypothetical protein